MIAQVIDKYHIEEKLGEGGMGVVYKANDTVLERAVALKVLHPGLARDERFLKRFRAEARALARLEDPSIVAVFDLLETDLGLFIVMQFVEGETLSDRLKKHGALPLETALAIVKQVLNALVHAHQAGVTHRDLKPANLMLTSLDTIKITDFGLAKIHADQTFTHSSSTGGTLCYMPPEQIQNLSNVDQRSDIYSIGMTLYEMLAGRLPLEKSENIYTLSKQIVEEEFLPPHNYRPAVAKALSSIVLKAIAKSADERYQTAEELLAAITEFEETQQPRKYKSVMKRPIIQYVFFAAVVMILATLGAYYFFSEKPQTNSVLLLPPPDSQGLNANEDSLAAASSQTEQADEEQIFSPEVVDNKLVSSYAARTESKPGREVLNGAVSRFGALNINVQPSGGVEVFLNGQSFGEEVSTINRLSPGAYTLSLKKLGYQDYSTSLDIAAGQMRNLNVSLALVAGKLNILAIPSGSIFVDGKLRKEDWSSLFETDLPPGSHLVKVEHPTLGVWEKIMEIKQDSLHVLQVDFNTEVTVTVAVAAGWGEIFVDGVATGRDTPAQIKLRIGTHKIEVRREGFIVEGGPREVNLVHNLDEPLVFSLKKRP